MNWNAIRAIVRKDLKVVFQNKGVSIPLIMAPIIMLVALPVVVAVLAPGLGDMVPAGSAGGMIQGMSGVEAALAGYDEAQSLVVYVLVYMLAPLFLILPVVSSMSIACDSFAGEKERKTLEALLYTPTTDGELLLGKLLSASLPALGIAWGGFLVYAVTVNLAGWPVMGRLFFPTTMWVILAAWVAPAAAGLGVCAAVLISSRARTFQEAYQIGAMVILPVFMLLVAQVSGVVTFSAWLVALLGLAFWAIDAALLWLGKRGFRRDKLATQV